MEVDLLAFDDVSYSQKVGVEDGLFSSPFRPDLISLVINWQLAKRRSGTHSSKGVSEVSGTTRKPYRQKGTGRARQGSLRSVQFRGGGVAFGPVVRSHAFCVNKKVRRFALRSALSLKASCGAIFALKDTCFPSAKTSDLVGWIEGNKYLNPASRVLVVLPQRDENLLLASSNLHRVKVLYNSAVNVYDLITHDLIVINQISMKDLASRLL